MSNQLRQGEINQTLQTLMAEWTAAELSGSRDHLKVVLGAYFPSVYVSLEKCAVHSPFFKRILEQREEEISMCNEQCSRAFGYRNPGLSQEQYKEELQQHREVMIDKLMREVHLFQQPEIDLRHEFQKLQEIKSKIRANIFNQNENTELGPFMKADYSQIPVALLICLLRHVTHGEPLSLGSAPPERSPSVHLQLCFGLTTLAHLLKLRSLEQELVQGKLVPEILSINNAVQVCQFSALHVHSCRQALYAYQLQTDPEQALENNSAGLMVECDTLTDLNDNLMMWAALYQRTQHLICNDICWVIQADKQGFMELKFFEDPLVHHDHGPVPQNEYQRELLDALRQEQDVASQILVQVIFNHWLNQDSFNFAPVMDMLCELRGFQSIFELLDFEKRRIHTQLAAIDINQIPPMHVWDIEKLDKMMIKADFPFVLSNIVWKLGLTYNHAKDQTLNANINIVVNPFADKKSKMYFRKNEYFLPSNSQALSRLGGNHAIEILPADFEDRDEDEKEQLRQFKEKIEQAVKSYPQHSFVSFVAAAKLNNDKYQEPTVATIIVSSKSPQVISKFQYFVIDDYVDQANNGRSVLQIGIALRVQRVLSAVLSTISRNFSLYCGDPKISLLPAEDFKTILKHKRLQVYHEDHVLHALYFWSQGNNIRQSHIDNVLQDINWNYVTTTALLELAQKSQKLRMNAEFQKLFKKEVIFRVKLNQDMVNKIQEPRYCFKYKTNSVVIGDKAQGILNEEENLIKKEVVQQNINFISDLIQFFFGNVNPLPEIEASMSLKDRFLQSHAEIHALMGLVK